VADLLSSSGANAGDLALYAPVLGLWRRRGPPATLWATIPGAVMSLRAWPDEAAPRARHRCARVVRAGVRRRRSAPQPRHAHRCRTRCGPRSRSSCSVWSATSCAPRTAIGLLMRAARPT